MQEACLGYYISLCPSSERELFRCATFRNIGHEVLICYFGLELEPDQGCQHFPQATELRCTADGIYAVATSCGQQAQEYKKYGFLLRARSLASFCSRHSLTRFCRFFEALPPSRLSFPEEAEDLNRETAAAHSCDISVLFRSWRRKTRLLLLQ